MYIDTVPNRKSPPAILIRESYRKNWKVLKRTIANISKLTPEQIQLIRDNIAGKKLIDKDLFREQMLKIVSSFQHWNIEAVKLAMWQLDIANLLSSSKSNINCKEKNIIMGLICSRIIRPESKLATNTWWNNTTIREEFNIWNTSEDDIYKAMNWLLKQKPYIEMKLSKRHFETEENTVLYDLSSSYFEWETCPLAKRWYNRDNKKWKLQVNYWLMTNKYWIPVSIDIFSGNVWDTKTVMKQVTKARNKFWIKKIIFIWDRGMITQKQVDLFRSDEDIKDNLYWITWLKSQTIKKLIKNDNIKTNSFDEKSLFEILHPDFPWERLIACKNTSLAKRRELIRESLMQATEEELKIIKQRVKNWTYEWKDKIWLEVWKIVNKYKVAKHFTIKITPKKFEYSRYQENIDLESKLDWIYILRTNLSSEEMSDYNIVRNYKSLMYVEEAYRSMKTTDLHIRPIYHYNKDRVKAHIFLCMISYYVQLHMKQALKPYLFAEEDLEQSKQDRDPVTTAKPSKNTASKAISKQTKKWIPVMKFRNILENLSTIVKNKCTTGNSTDTSEESVLIDLTTEKSEYQLKIFEELKKISL